VKAPVIFSAALLLAAPVFAARPEKIDYNRDIRPILSNNCFYCHGPDKTHREAKMRLDVREDALKKEAFVPGKPDESELVIRLFTKDDDELMPPPDSHKKLTPEQKELLKRWIAEDAPYAPHWSYIAPQRPAVPVASAQSSVQSAQSSPAENAGARTAGKPLSTEHSALSTSQNPIDAFVRHELAQRKIAPSKEVDARTLIRRLTLDLTGLPPTPAAVETFVQAWAEPEGRDAVYSAQVERLLASPCYGERMAVPWLDLVRYADTVGFHGDQNVNVFPYRDWVIGAFNDNKPFDQFTIEQLAGDLLPNPTESQRVATAFNRLNMVTREGGAQSKEYLAKYAADRVRTVGTAWLGSTIQCAECHDHKFDPITAKDFYSLAAFFADVKQWGVYSDYSYTPNPELKGWSNEHPFPPEVEVPSPYLQQRAARLEAEYRAQIGAVAQRLLADPKKRAALEAWRERMRGFLAARPEGWRPLKPVPEVSGTKKGAKPAEPPVVAEADEVLRFRRKAAKEEKIRVVLDAGGGSWAALRVEILPGAGEITDPSYLGAQRTGLKLSLAVRSRDGKERNVGISFAEADAKQPRYNDGFEVIGVQGGWKVGFEEIKKGATSVWLFDGPQALAPGEKLVVSLDGDTQAPLRFSSSPLAARDPLTAADEKPRAAVWAEKPDAILVERYLWSTAADRPALAEARRMRGEILACRGGRARVVVTERMEPLTTRLLPRGNWQDETGPILEPAPPHFLTPVVSPKEGERLTRLDLARWLVAPENPLTARVFVNRLWKQFFGIALSAQVDELGAQGEWPSHPELLDWLAVEFRESGWNVKHLVRLLVNSVTYRQDANLRPELKDIDPQNRLLASQNPRRLEAEFVRDNALAIAGALNLEIGGPSVHPYQPAGYYAQLQFPDRDYVASTDDRQYRRGLYSHWQRTFLHPMLANFDAPSREECAAFRTQANTPQQALTLLNDPSFVEAARLFAEKLLTRPGDDAQHLEAAFAQALARPPRPSERTSLTAFLATQREHFRNTPDDAKAVPTVGLATVSPNLDAAELAAWTQVCRVVLNLHETITRY